MANPEQTGTVNPNPRELENQARELGNEIAEQAANAENEVVEQIDQAKDTVTQPVDTPSSPRRQVSPEHLRQRLQWGEPALTILDAREREAFNQERLKGAVPMPFGKMVDTAENTLEKSRDIYVYANDEGQTAQAASQLRDAGFTNVAELQGGLKAWKAAGGSIEGTAAV